MTLSFLFFFLLQSFTVPKGTHVRSVVTINFYVTVPLDNGHNINPERRAHDFFLLYVLVYQHYAFFIVHISIFKHNYIWCTVARI